MFKRLIGNIRKKPKATRDKIAMSIAGLFTTLVFMAWVYTMPSRFTPLNESPQQDDAEPAFSQLFSSIKDTFSNPTVDEEDVAVKMVAPEDLRVERGMTASVSDSQNYDIYPSTSTEIFSGENYGFAEPEPAPAPRTIRIVTTSSASSSKSSENE